MQSIIRVRVIDVNDNDPVFDEAIYRFNTSENDASKKFGTFVGKVQASDRDLGMNGQITYKITSRNGEGLFAISKVSVMVIIRGSIGSHSVQ